MVQEIPGAGNRSTVRWNQTTKVVIFVLLIILAGLAFYFFRIIFVPLIIGAIMAYILSPVVQFMNKKMRIPHGLATGIVYLILLAVVITLPVSLFPWISDKVLFLRDEFIGFVDYLDTISSNTVQFLGFELVVGDIVLEVTNAITNLITEAATLSLEVVFSAAEILLLVIFTFLIGFYLTKDSEKFLGWFRGLVPDEYRGDLNQLFEEIDAIWSAFFRGQLLLAIVVSIILTTVASILGLSQPILLGVLGGLLEFLPSIGHGIWLVVASVLAIVEGSSWIPVSNFVFLLIVIGVQIAYSQFDLNFLIPRIIGRQVHLHPMIVIIGIIIGAQVGGVLGVALASPTIASARVVGRYIYALLFDMDPFPMVGPPSAPVSQRQEQAEILASQEPVPLPTLPSPSEALQKIRHRRRKDRADQQNDDAAGAASEASADLEEQQSGAE